jgi:hypothetical protein
MQPLQKFKKSVFSKANYSALPKSSNPTTGFLYMVEVYVNNFMSLVIPVSQEQIRHVPSAVMMGIHDVFLPDTNDSNNPISNKKLLKNKGQYSTLKTLLGF